MRGLLHCSVQVQCTMIALLTIYKTATVVLPVVCKQMLYCLNTTICCNLKHVGSKDVGRVVGIFRNLPFLGTSDDLSPKETFDLRFTLGFAVSCFAVSRRTSSIVQLVSFIKLAANKGAGNFQSRQPYGVLRSSFIPHFNNHSSRQVSTPTFRSRQLVRGQDQGGQL